jgi:membrane fusion protein (multidrug efflux system)
MLGLMEFRRAGVVPLVMVSLLAGCAQRGAPNAESGAPPIAVVVATVRPQTVPIRTDFVGTTTAVQSVDIRARVKGTLDRVYFKEGSVVRAGQLLFAIQKAPYLAAMQAAQATVLKARAQLYQARASVPVLQASAVVAQNRAHVGQQQLSVDRLTPLASAHAVPQSDLDNATANLAAAKADLAASEASLTTTRVTQQGNVEGAKAAVLSAEADLANARLNLSYCTVTSPITGIIGFLKWDVGNIVGDSDSQVLDTVSTVDPIAVRFAADENTYLTIASRRNTYAGHPLAEQPISLVLSNNQTFSHTGALYAAGRSLDTKTATITVEARFPNPGGLLRPGQFGRVRLVSEELRNAIVIPQIAVVQTQGANSAYVVQPDGTVAQRSLSLGPMVGNDEVVLSGLHAGDRVVVQGVQKIAPGQRVTTTAAR